MAQMRADIGLKRIQAQTEDQKIWIAAIAAVGVVMGAVAGMFGYILGSHH